jgi:hypothetical protein
MPNLAQVNYLRGITLVGTEQDEDYNTTQYACDFVVETAGDGYWGCEAGRKVRVTGIAVIEHTFEDGDTWTAINVEHDSTWDIYTDTAFEAAISEALGYEVCFTEQGMQGDKCASMELCGTVL